MKGIENLKVIRDSESLENIRQMTRCFIDKVNPLKVILFGSFADGSYTDESDYDFYLVVEDGRNVSDATDAAYHSVLDVKNRPVDIVVGTNHRFEMMKNVKISFTVEDEVHKKGILLYDQTSA